MRICQKTNLKELQKTGSMNFGRRSQSIELENMLISNSLVECGFIIDNEDKSIDDDRICEEYVIKLLSSLEFTISRWQCLITLLICKTDSIEKSNSTSSDELTWRISDESVDHILSWTIRLLAQLLLQSNVNSISLLDNKHLLNICSQLSSLCNIILSKYVNRPSISLNYEELFSNLINFLTACSLTTIHNHHVDCLAAVSHLIHISDSSDVIEDDLKRREFNKQIFLILDGIVLNVMRKLCIEQSGLSRSDELCLIQCLSILLSVISQRDAYVFSLLPDEESSISDYIFSHLDSLDFINALLIIYTQKRNSSESAQLNLSIVNLLLGMCTFGKCGPCKENCEKLSLHLSSLINAFRWPLIDQLDLSSPILVQLYQREIQLVCLLFDVLCCDPVSTYLIEIFCLNHNEQFNYILSLWSKQLKSITHKQNDIDVRSRKGYPSLISDEESIVNAKESMDRSALVAPFCELVDAGVLNVEMLNLASTVMQIFWRVDRFNCSKTSVPWTNSVADHVIIHSSRGLSTSTLPSNVNLSVIEMAETQIHLAASLLNKHGYSMSSASSSGRLSRHNSMNLSGAQSKPAKGKGGMKRSTSIISNVTTPTVFSTAKPGHKNDLIRLLKHLSNALAVVASQMPLLGSLSLMSNYEVLEMYPIVDIAFNSPSLFDANQTLSFGTLCTLAHITGTMFYKMGSASAFGKDEKSVLALYLARSLDLTLAILYTQTFISLMSSKLDQPRKQILVREIFTELKSLASHFYGRCSGRRSLQTRSPGGGSSSRQASPSQSPAVQHYNADVNESLPDKSNTSINILQGAYINTENMLVKQLGKFLDFLK